MCLSVPAIVIEVYESEKQAKVDYMGSRFKIGIALLEQVVEGQYVLVHAGEAIQIVDKERAMDGLALWKEMLGEA
ncbi:hydrogenase 2 accessory protein HypG [compost metagenome]